MFAHHIFRIGSNTSRRKLAQSKSERISYPSHIHAETRGRKEQEAGRAIEIEGRRGIAKVSVWFSNGRTRPTKGRAARQPVETFSRSKFSIRPSVFYMKRAALLKVFVSVIKTKVDNRWCSRARLFFVIDCFVRIVCIVLIVFRCSWKVNLLASPGRDFYRDPGRKGCLYGGEGRRHSIAAYLLPTFLSNKSRDLFLPSLRSVILIITCARVLKHHVDWKLLFIVFVLIW